MENPFVSEEILLKVEFYDVDSMNVVWHGNYVKYMESARCALLDKIGYGYQEMVKDGFAFPVTSIRLKYIRSLFFGETVKIRASLLEYENRIKISYQFYDKDDRLTTKAESVQMALKIDTHETQFVCPPSLIQKVEKLIAEGKKDE